MGFIFIFILDLLCIWLMCCLLKHYGQCILDYTWIDIWKLVLRVGYILFYVWIKVESNMAFLWMRTASSFICCSLDAFCLLSLFNWSHDYILLGYKFAHDYKPIISEEVVPARIWMALEMWHWLDSIYSWLEQLVKWWTRFRYKIFVQKANKWS